MHTGSCIDANSSLQGLGKSLGHLQILGAVCQESNTPVL